MSGCDSRRVRAALCTGFNIVVIDAQTLSVLAQSQIDTLPGGLNQGAKHDEGNVGLVVEFLRKLAADELDDVKERTAKERQREPNPRPLMPLLLSCYC